MYSQKLWHLCFVLRFIHYLIFSAISTYFYDQNEESKKKKLDLLIKETIPFYMERLEKQIKENGGYLVNGKVSAVNYNRLSLAKSWDLSFKNEVFRR